MMENLSNFFKDAPPRVVSLLALGIEVFGTERLFFNWLIKENFFFDKQAPSKFLGSDYGTKFIKDRLFGIQYGDNA